MTGMERLKAGTILRVDGGRDGLTQLEAAARDGNLDKYISSVTPEIRAALAETANGAVEDITQRTLKSMSTIQPRVTEPKTLNDLEPAERSRVLGVLRNLGLEKVAGLQESPVEFDPREYTDIREAPPDDADELAMLDSLVPPPPLYVAPTVNSSGSLTLAPPPPEPQLPVPAEPVTEARPRICPNCAWNCEADPAAITDEDKYGWMRAILGGKAFHKTYSLLGNRLNVTFRSRSMKDVDLVNDQLRREHEDGRIPSMPAQLSMAIHQLRLRKLDMVASLAGWQTVKSGNLALPLMSSPDAVARYQPSGANNVIGAAHESLCGGWDEAFYSILFKQFMVFDDLCHRLKEAAASPGFWEGTAGAA